jgi:hypothetical protein
LNASGDAEERKKRKQNSNKKNIHMNGKTMSMKVPVNIQTKMNMKKTWEANMIGTM